MNSRVSFGSHISILLIYLVHCEEVRVQALDRLEPQDIANVIPNENGAIYGYVWHEIREYYREFQKVMPVVELKGKLMANYSVMAMPEVAKANLLLNIDKIYEYDGSQCEPPQGLRKMSEVLTVCRFTTKIRNALLDETGPQELCDIAKEGLSDVTFNEVEFLDPGIDALSLLRKTEHTGSLGNQEISYFNKLTNGGPREGDIGLIVGPTGGFKTTMAVDIVCSMAKVGQYSMFSSYEQGVDGGDLTLRFISRLSGIPRPTLEHTEDFGANGKPEEIEAVRSITKYSKYIKWADRMGCVDRPSDIDAQIGSLVRKGMKPEVVVIDQLLQWIQKWPEFKADSDSSLRHGIDNAMQALKQIALKYKTRIIVLHQLTGAKNASSATYKPSIADCAEHKGAANWVDFAIMMGKQCTESGCLWGVAVKARGGVCSSLILKPRGELYRISEGSSYKASGGRHFKLIKDINKIPGEDSRNF